MRKYIGYLFGFLTLIVALLYILSALYADMHNQLVEQKEKGKCIAYYVSLGIERRDIETDGARCWVKADSQS